MNLDSRERYGRVTRFFHWSMAVLVAWQALKIGDRIDEGEHWVGNVLVPWHVSIGTLLLLLVAARLAWAWSQRERRPLPDPATAFAVKAGHALLYLALLLMPLTGISRMIGKGYGLKAFGVQLVPRGEKIPWLASIGELHSPIAWALVALIVGHVAIALFHHLVRRDGVLRRMA